MGYEPIRSREDFTRLVHLGTSFETTHLEFKRTYNWQVADHDARQREALASCRDIAAFANTEGGVVLIGVDEQERADGRRVATDIFPVTDTSGLRAWLEQAIRNYLTPSTFSRSIMPVDTDKGPILAVDVRPSVSLVALWHQVRARGSEHPYIEYLYRTDHGNEWMNPDEAEKHIMNSSRATVLRLKEVEEKVGKMDGKPVELAPAVYLVVPHHPTRNPRPELAPQPQPRARVFWTQTTEHGIHIQVSLPDDKPGGMTVISLPFGLIRDAWVTSDGRPGLCLGVRIVFHQAGVYVLEPL